nr:vanadium-dependent haloperoxidase [uncultured Arsenicibacter sp.]
MKQQLHVHSKTRRQASATGIALLLLLLSFLQSCRQNPESESVSPNGQSADKLTNEVAVKWASMHLRLLRQSAGFSPPVASRALGFAGVTMYEAAVPGISDRRSLAGQLQGLSSLPQIEAGKGYNWNLSVNAGQAAILRSLHANASAAAKTAVDSLESALFTQFKSASQEENDRSTAFGKSVADAIFTWSKTDGGHEGYTRNFPADYSVPVGTGFWRPTENGQKIPMQPFWGRNRLFVASSSTMPVPEPLAISTSPTSQYYAQYLEVYTKNMTLTQAEKEISIWWADDPSETFTPPGHSYNLARIAVKTSNANLGRSVEAFARVGMAVADAFVHCWKCKYAFMNERPYTFVRRAIDPSWVPFWPAPPFPGYTSGHATQSAAAATVLTGLFGDSFAFTDDSHVSRVRDTKRNTDFKARSFKSFWESAEESAFSRFLGGIHTRQDNETGLREGRTLGRNINALNWMK